MDVFFICHDVFSPRKWQVNKSPPFFQGDLPSACCSKLRKKYSANFPMSWNNIRDMPTLWSKCFSQWRMLFLRQSWIHWEIHAGFIFHSQEIIIFSSMKYIPIFMNTMPPYSHSHAKLYNFVLYSKNIEQESNALKVLCLWQMLHLFYWSHHHVML